MRISALIVAAGKGTRMGADKNKLLLKIGEKTILQYTLERFVQNALIYDIIVVAAQEDLAEVDRLCSRYAKGIRVVEGASTRTLSVLSGLKAADPSTEIILIHDGARPFVSDNIIKSCIDDVRVYGSAVTAVPVTETIKTADANLVVTSTLDRNELYKVQTPQGFLYKDIMLAYSKIQPHDSFTDDSSVYEKYVGKPYLCMGEAANIKITYTDDLNAFFKEHSMFKCGMGYDSHPFKAGRKFVLGGVDIPHDKGLDGHSDADALLHAVADSILSAAGLPDIGTQFPDTDAAFKDASSMTLLQQVCDKINALGLKVGNVSAVIICQSPKLAAFIPLMRSNIAAVLGCGESGVGISAKTNEKLGFIGRGEGIAVTASCLLTSAAG